MAQSTADVVSEMRRFMARSLALTVAIVVPLIIGLILWTNANTARVACEHSNKITTKMSGAFRDATARPPIPPATTTSTTPEQKARTDAFFADFGRLERC